jgi:heptosyltransferase III
VGAATQPGEPAATQRLQRAGQKPAGPEQLACRLGGRPWSSLGRRDAAVSTPPAHAYIHPPDEPTTSSRPERLCRLDAGRTGKTTMSLTQRHVALVLGALGDFILTLPLLCALRQRGSVTLCTRGAYRALLPAALAEAPFVDLDGAVGAYLFADSAETPAALVALLQGAAVHAFMRPDAALARTAERAGAARLVWHDPRPVAPPHIVLRFFATAGLDAPPRLLETPVLPRSPRAGQALWLHAGSGSPAKNVPLDWLADLAQREARPWEDRTIVSFGEADLELVAPLTTALRGRGLAVEPLVCPTLGELRRRLESDAGACIGADTGVTHLAAALGIPTTAVFRSTDPAIWRPVGRVQVIRLPGP